MKSVEMRQKIAGKVARARAIQDNADREQRDMSPEEAQEFQQVMADVADLKQRVASIEQLEAEEQQVASVDTERSARSMPHHETKHPYSVLRAIRSFLNGRQLDGLEREVNDEIARRSGKPAKGFYVPWDLRMMQKRDLTTSTASGAVATVTDSSLIEYLRNKSLLNQLGAKTLNDMQGNFALPKQTGTTTAYWVSEGSSPTESTAAIGQVSFAPKTVGAFTDLSRKFILQTSVDAEQFARQDLVDVIALETDRAGFNGSGSGAEPTGILQNSSVTTVAIGTNGGAPTYSHFVSLETTVAAANADIGNLAYVTTANCRGKLKVTPRESGYPSYIWGDDNTVNGYSAYATNQLPSNLTKGTGTALSAAIFGNWADMVIAYWGGLDVLVDPYTGSTTGNVRIVVMQDLDIKLRHAESFAKIVDIVTT